MSTLSAHSHTCHTSSVRSCAILSIGFPQSYSVSGTVKLTWWWCSHLPLVNPSVQLKAFVVWTIILWILECHLVQWIDVHSVVISWKQAFVSLVCLWVLLSQSEWNCRWKFAQFCRVTASKCAELLDTSMTNSQDSKVLSHQETSL